MISSIVADTDVLVEHIIQSPRLPVYYRRIHDLLEDERRRRQEFYETITEDVKAEFINGEVIMHSPARFEHSETSRNLFTLLDVYVSIHDLGFAAFEKVMVSLTRNDYEPDICFFGQTRASQIAKGQTRYPAPDFIAEFLSTSTKARDRGIKFQDYASHGVTEYWIIDPDTEIVEQYVLQAGTFELKIKAQSGEVASVAIPGFAIPVRAIFDQEEKRATLRLLIV